MALPTASDNPFPSLLIVEGTEPAAPAAGRQRLYIDSTTHKLKRTDSSGVDITIEGTAGAASDGWVDDTAETWTYATGSGGGVATFTVPTDLTSKYTPGTRIKLTQTTVKYFVVVSSAYSSPNTTVTITAGSDYTLANAAISANYHSYAVNPQGYPGWFNFAAAATGFSSLSSTGAKFAMVGRHVFLDLDLAGTSNATTFTITAPVSSSIAGSQYRQIMTLNSGTAAMALAFAGPTTSIQFFSNLAAAAFTASGTKAARGELNYLV